MQIKSKKILAMTLVELLAVLTILGTLTALTLPGLKKHTQKVENAKLAQQAYNLLEQAIDNEIAITGKAPNEWDENSDMGSYLLKNHLAKYFFKAKDCVDTWGNNKGCFAAYRSFKSSQVNNPSVRAFILPSGAVIAGEGRRSGSPARFFIDVNNTQAPNMEGVDLFVFEFAKYDENCQKSTTGQWKLCPIEHSKNLIEDGWNITYW